MAEKKTTKKTKDVEQGTETLVDIKDVKVSENKETVNVDVVAQVNTALESVETTVTLEPTGEIGQTPYGPDEPAPAEEDEKHYEDGEPAETDVPEVNPEVSKDAEAVAEANAELEESKEKLSESLANAKTTDEAKELIENEIKKVEDLKKKNEKIIRKYSNMQVSNSWNGMIEDW